MDKPVMVEIIGVKEESKNHKTFTLDVKVDAVPGQFCMLWLPGLNEKPMSFSGIGEQAKVTVKKLGDFTKQMFRMKQGDEIGFRGPYGRGFAVLDGEACLVGGGCGIAPLLPLADEVDGLAIVAAKSRSDLILVKEFRDSGLDVVVATDDGSEGVKGFAHEVLAQQISERDFGCVYTCGPEVMMKTIMDVCDESDTECQLSLERYMKCGIGICGSCTLSGMRVCVEGPVFNADELRGTEFGVYTRDGCGCRRVI
ncbi:MAG: dihydroorotate dehydrogenase electron transfer subunit [Candidatus Altiarchaeota archaeon]